MQKIQSKQIQQLDVPVGVLNPNTLTDNYFPIVSGSSVIWTSEIPSRLTTIAGINTLSPATTNLYTVPTGLTTIIYSVVLRCAAASAITDEATISIGVAAGENDVFSAIKITGVKLVNDSWTFPPIGKAIRLLSGNILKLRVNTAATGTSQIIAADVIGYQF